MEEVNMNKKVETGTRIYNSNGYVKVSYTPHFLEFKFTQINTPFDTVHLESFLIDKESISILVNKGYFIERDNNTIAEFRLTENKQIEINILHTTYENVHTGEIKGQRYKFYIDYYNFYENFKFKKPINMVCCMKANKPVIKWHGINMVKLKQENKTQYNQLIKKLKDFTTWEAISIDLYNDWNHGDVYFVIRHHSRLTGLEGGIIWHRDFGKKAGGYYSMHT
jgi:hypothetical protein